MMSEYPFEHLHLRLLLVELNLHHTPRVGENSVRMDGFKLEGGELFKEDFCKLLKQE